MCSRAECEQNIGKFVQFRTPYGVHQGVIERITKNNRAIILSPKQYAPAQLLSDNADLSDVERLDLTLVWGGYGRGYPGRGYSGGAGGYPAYGYGWSRWAVSFLVIYALFGLWFW